MNELLTHKTRRSVWWGWGDPAEAHPISNRAWSVLEDALEIEKLDRPTPPVQLTNVELPASRLTEKQLAQLQQLAEVKVDRRARIEHAAGKSYPDIYRLRHGRPISAPDAVAFPSDEAEIQALLNFCQEQEINVIPFGGGTSVVGGVTPQAVVDAKTQRPVISIDMRNFNRLIHFDALSQTATLQTGMRGPEIEQALHSYGFTLGHYPQSHQQATLGGYLAARSSGQSSAGYGRPDERVIGLKMITPAGPLHLGDKAPASAAGPRLIDLAVGSEGTLGIITEATLTVARLPKVKRYGAWAFPTIEAGVNALRTITQELGHGWQPDVCRLSDAEETWVNLNLSGSAGAAISRWLKFKKVDKPCLLLLVWEGQDNAQLKTRERAATVYLKENQGISLPSAVVKAWEKGRFSGPYMRDELMGHNVLVETLETATTWDNLHRLHQAVRKAIRTSLTETGSKCIVMGHLSHVYTAGSSLYFTFIAPEDLNPVEQWQAVKQAACEAIVENGGTISHHHAVGADHRPYLPAEIGELGEQMLHAVKDVVDPKGIMNPGKLIK